MSHELKRIGVHVLVCTFLAPLSKLVKRYDLGFMEVQNPWPAHKQGDPTLCSITIRETPYPQASKIEIPIAFDADGSVWVNNASDHRIFQRLNQALEKRDSDTIPWLTACLHIVQFYKEQVNHSKNSTPNLMAALDAAASGIRFAFMATGENLTHWPMTY